MRFVSAVIIAFAGTVAAAAAPDCLLLKYESCRLWDSGVRTAEEYAARGDELLRVSARHALYGRDFDMDVVRTPEGSYWLRLRDPSNVGDGLTVAILAAEADSLTALWHKFQDSRASLDIPARKAALDKNPPCTDGGTVQVDWASGGKSGHVLIDDCLVPEVDRLVDTLAARAYDLTPLCAGFLRIGTPLCLRLENDKFAAADVAHLIDALRRNGNVTVLLLPGAEVIVNGTAFEARAWFKDNEAVWNQLDTLRIDGGKEVVSATGRILSIEQEVLPGNARRDHFSAASSLQVWRRGLDGRFGLVSWRIGVPVKVERWF